MKPLINNKAFKYNYDQASVGATTDPIKVELEEGYAIIYPMAPSPFVNLFKTPLIQVNIPELGLQVCGTLKEVTRMIAIARNKKEGK